MRFVSKGMRLLLLLALAAPVCAGEETRLGNLIRLYLAEKRPSRQFELVERIRRLTKDDGRAVAEAIRRGEHCRFAEHPVFARGGPKPRFHLQRLRLQPVADSAGDFAELVLPRGYDPKKVYPLVLDLGETGLPAAAGAVRVRVDWAHHSQARTQALAAEGLVLSLLAHTLETVHIDSNRIFLRGARAAASLALYIAFHNPDRFAGVLAVQGSWSGAARLAPNSTLFSILAVDRRRGDPDLKRFFDLAGMRRLHTLLPAPAAPKEDSLLLAPIARWQARRTRGPNPRSLRIIADREATTRAYWVRVAPVRRSIRRSRLGRTWEYKEVAIPGTFVAEIDPEDTNLVHVRTHRIAAFWIYADPRMFDRTRPLRVSINGGVPVANLIELNLGIDALLEDYAERRDPGLLYSAAFAYTVRRDPSHPPR